MIRWLRRLMIGRYGRMLEDLDALCDGLGIGPDDPVPVGVLREIGMKDADLAEFRSRHAERGAGATETTSGASE